MSSPHAVSAPSTARPRVARTIGGALLAGAIGVLLASLGCGRILAPKGPGEPCTRTTECRSDLVCSAGVCMPGPDGGATPLDASEPLEGGSRDAGEDVAQPSDAGAADPDAATATDDAAMSEDVGADPDASADAP